MLYVVRVLFGVGLSMLSTAGRCEQVPGIRSTGVSQNSMNRDSLLTLDIIDVYFYPWVIEFEYNTIIYFN